MHNFHVQQTQEATAEPKTQRLRHLGLILQGRVVELEFFKGVAQLVVFAGLGWVQACKHLRLHFFETRQGLGRGECRAARTQLDQRDGIAYFGSLQLFDTGNDVAHLTRAQRVTRHVMWCEHAQVVGDVGGTGGHHLDALALVQLAVHHAHQHHHADIGVVPTVDNHGAQRAVWIAFGRGDTGHHGFQDVIHTHAGFG